MFNTREGCRIVCLDLAMFDDDDCDDDDDGGDVDAKEMAATHISPASTLVAVRWRFLSLNFAHSLPKRRSVSWSWMMQDFVHQLEA